MSVAPDEASADGRVVFDLPIRSQGRNFKGVKLEFEGGRAVKLDGGPYFDILRKLYDASTGDKSKIGSLTIGINPKAKYGFLHDGIVSGAVGIGIGANEGLGGKNKTPYGLERIVGGGTLEVDGKTPVVNGRLKLRWYLPIRPKTFFRCHTEDSCLALILT